MFTKMIRLVSAALILALTLTLFAGCGKTVSVVVPDAADATPVSYSRSGKYVTTVTPSSEDIDLSGVTADTIVISCYPPADDAPAADSVRANGDGWDISFTDKHAADNLTSNYLITFEGIGQASVTVNFPAMTLASDVESVCAGYEGSDGATDLTLTLEGGSFESGIGKDDITLANAFEKMTVDSLSASGNKLMLRLKGTPVKNELINAYLFGSVAVKPSGIKDGYTEVAAKIDIAAQYAGIDRASLRYSDGRITADLIAYGSVNAAELTKDNVKIDGFVTEDVKLRDAHSATLTLSSNKIGSVNDFAELAAGKTMTLNGYETAVSLAQASFSGIYDYCEENGGNLDLTLLLTASGGAFAQKLTGDMFSLGGDFEGAAVRTVKRVSDAAAELVFSVPAGGMTAEDFDLSGTVSLAEGALANMWGEDAPARLTVVRASSCGELNRNGDINTIYSAVNTVRTLLTDKDSTFASIIRWSTGGLASIKFGMEFLYMLGVVDYDPSYESEQLVQVLDELQNIESILDQQTLALERIELSESKSDFADYNKDFRDMLSAMEGMKALYKNARDDYAPKVALVGEPLPKYMVDKNIQPEKWLDWDSASIEERVEYSESLTNIIIYGSTDPGNTRYTNYKLYSDDLNRSFRSVTGYLMGTEKEFLNKNPLDAFDEYCTKRYNFDTQAYVPRYAYRVVAEERLTEVMGMLHMLYKTGSSPENHDFLMLSGRFETAVNNIENSMPQGLRAEEVRCYPHYETVETDMTYISEIKLAGWDSDYMTPIRTLQNEGYTVINYDLNNGAGGHWIYLGYKTTKNYSDAIKDIIVREGSGQNNDVVVINGREYRLSPYTGDSEFLENKGELNENAGGSDLFLYYSKQDGADSTAVYNMRVDGSSSGAVSSKDLNKGAGGDYIYLHLDKCDPARKGSAKVMTDDDPSLFPFCYTLGRKVCVTRGADYKYASESHDEWQQVEIDRFIQRASNPTVAEELRSAGILRDDYAVLTGLPFVTNIRSEYMTITEWEQDNRSGRKANTTEYKFSQWWVKGDCFYPNGYSLSKDIDIATIRDPNNNRKNYPDIVNTDFITFRFK